MKRLGLSIVSAAALLSGSLAADSAYNSKTFLNPQQAGFMTGRDMVGCRYDREEKNGATKFGMTAFWEQSNNGNAIGQYFGVGNGTNSFQVGSSAATPAPDVDGGYLFHDEQVAGTANGPSNLAGLVTLSPERTVFGVNLNLQRDFCGSVKGLFFRLNVPVVYVSNDLGVTYANQSTATITDGSTVQSATVQNFFSGDVNIIDAGSNSATNLQSPLTNGIFNTQAVTSGGFGDVQAMLGYTFFQGEKAAASWYLEGIFPTSNAPDAINLFEPLRGNAGHFGLTVGVDAQVDLWKKNDWQVQMRGLGKVTYFFENSETRVLGTQNLIAADNGAGIHNANFGQYGLVSAGVLTTASELPLIPAANILAQSVNVTPGVQLEYGVQNRFVYKKLTIALGYGFMFRDNESVELDTFTNSNYAIVEKDYAVGSADLEAFPLAIGNISTDAAETPAQSTYKFSAEFGYNPEFKRCDSLTFACGGVYQYSPNNAAFSQYGAWASMNVAF